MSGPTTRAKALQKRLGTGVAAADPMTTSSDKVRLLHQIQEFPKVTDVSIWFNPLVACVYLGSQE